MIAFKAVTASVAKYFYSRVLTALSVVCSLNLFAIFFVFAEWLLYSMIASEILDCFLAYVPFEIFYKEK